MLLKQTVTPALLLVTVVSSIVMILLFISETVSFMRVQVAEQLYVDSTSAEQRVDIRFDITFFRLPCSVITVDIMDASGDNQDDIEDEVYKVSIDAEGDKKSEYHPVRCCNTCDEVKEAYILKGWELKDIEEIDQCKVDTWLKTLVQHRNESCRVYGRVQVAKVAGNLHIAPGEPHRSFRTHYHDLHSLNPSKFDTSHIVNHLSFGNPFPGKTYPLDGRSFGVGGNSAGIMYQYFVKLVPTMYVFLDPSQNIFSHQFSVVPHQKNIALGASGLPGFFVHYEFSPLMIKYLSSFLVSLCAIIGGVFTVASLIDSFIYRSSRIIQKKIALNKFT